MTISTTCDRRTFNRTILASALGLSAGVIRGASRPEHRNLADDQSPARNQRERGTCYVHSVVAALEAAYKRAGYGELDLSEEFANDATRMFWLEPRPNKRLAAHVRENRHSMGHEESRRGAGDADEGGFGDGVANFMAECGFAIPEEKHLPYRSHGPRKRTEWNVQYLVDSFNLDPRNFDGAALAKVKYFGMRNCEDIKCNSPEAIEDALLRGREVIWGFRVAGDRDGCVWEYQRGSKDEGGHSMLIHGFDRTFCKGPYFVVKNSWENQSTVCLSYEYLRRYGTSATTIAEVAPPRTWAELAYLGRWSLRIDGRSGILDLYHLPGMSKTAFEAHDLTDPRTGKPMEDRRLGTFFVDGRFNKAFRVNGSVSKDGLRLNLDWSDPGCAYNHTSGQQFTLRFAGDDREVMTGELRCGTEGGERVAATRLRDAKHFENA